jgi:hypothetical protein
MGAGCPGGSDQADRGRCREKITCPDGPSRSRAPKAKPVTSADVEQDVAGSQLSLVQNAISHWVEELGQIALPATRSSATRPLTWELILAWSRTASRPTCRSYSPPRCMCWAKAGGWSAVLAPVQGIFAAQEIRPQARVLAQDRGIRCITLDYESMRGAVDDTLRLF